MKIEKSGSCCGGYDDLTYSSRFLDKIKSDLFFKEHEKLDLRNEPNAIKYTIKPITHKYPETNFVKKVGSPFIDNKLTKMHLQSDYDVCNNIHHFQLRYNGIACRLAINEPDFERGLNIDPDSVQDYIVNTLKNEYNNYILKERFGMTNVDFNQIEASIRSRGGYMDFETVPGYESMANIHLPLEMLKDLRFNDPTENFLTKEFVTGNKLDIPAITSIKFYNDRATIMKFADGTETKVETQNGEPFNSDTGMAYCMFKKILGKDGHRKFNDLMRAAHKQLDKQEKDKKIAEENKQKEKRWREKAKAEKNRRKAKKRNEEISLQKEAIVQALQYLNSLNNGGGNNV